MKSSLSPKDLALAIGASESSVKRWADDGTIQSARTAGGHRRIALAEALRFVRDSHLPLVRPDVLGLADLSALARAPGDAQTPADRLHTFLVEGRAAEARGLLLSLHLEGASVAALADGPVRDAMARIGELWHADTGGILVEHRATDICLHAVVQLQLLLAVRDDAPLALGGACAGDYSMLPTTLAATTLLESGFRAVNLGANTPVHSLLRGLETDRPAILWLSASHVLDAKALHRELKELVERARAAGTHLVLGGSAVDQIDVPSSPLLVRAERMAELAALAKGMRHAAAPRR